MKASQAPELNRGLPAAVVSLSEQVKRISLDSKRRYNLGEDPYNDLYEDHIDFVMSHGLSTAEAQDLLKEWGRNELVRKVTPTWLIVFRLVIFENKPCCPLRTQKSTNK
jgi:hypothetical protein